MRNVVEMFYLHLCNPIIINILHINYGMGGVMRDGRVVCDEKDWGPGPFPE